MNRPKKGGNAWTDEDLANVVESTANLMKKGGASLAEALFTAQELYVPPERHLARTSLMSYTKHAAALREALTAAGVQYPYKPRRTKVQMQAIRAEAVKPAPEAPPSVLVVTLHNATQSQLIEQFLINQQRIMKREIEQEIALSIASAFETDSSTQATGDGAAVSKPVRVKGFPRFFVCGLLPMQASILQQRLGDKCELRFWKDQSNDKLRAGAGWADHIVSMTKFISHDTERIFKNMEKPILRCNGAVTDLVAQIERALVVG